MKEKLFAIAIGFCTIFASCSIQNKGIRSIRAHTIDKGGVAHAPSALRAERYCQSCHGQNLLGGTHGEPSCYTCHGQRWIAYDPALVLAPSTHTLDRAGYMHHSLISDVQGTCTQCHGSKLGGLGDDGPPSCTLCHDALWEP